MRARMHSCNLTALMCCWCVGATGVVSGLSALPCSVVAECMCVPLRPAHHPADGRPGTQALKRVSCWQGNNILMPVLGT